MSRHNGPRAALCLFAALWGLTPALVHGQTSKTTRPPANNATGDRQTGGNEANAEARGRQGQGPGGANAFAMFNNPADQLRRLRTEISTRPRNNGGPGGAGGGPPMMGGFGGGGGIIGLLLRSQPLQEELKLSEQQRATLTEINQNGREKMRQIFGQGGGGRGGINSRNQDGQGGQNGGPQRFQFDPQRFQEMQEQFAEMREENETAVGNILTAAQKKRLNEIRLRILGPFAVAEEDVAQAIPLSEEQYEKIMDIMTAYDQENMALMQEQFQGMRDRFGRGGRNGQGGPGAAPGQGQGPGARRNQVNQNQQDAGDEEEAPAPRAGRRQPAAQDEDNGDAPPARNNRQRPAQNNGDEEDDANPTGNNRPGQAPGGQGQGGRRGFQFTPEQQEEMQKRLTEMRSKQDVIDQRAEAEIRKVLTPANRAKFNKMLGADFDLSKLAQAPDFGGGPNGRRGRNQDGGDNPRGNNNANAPRGQNNAPGNDAAPADGNDSDDQKSAPQRPRTRPQPRVRGTN